MVNDRHAERSQERRQLGGLHARWPAAGERRRRWNGAAVECQHARGADAGAIRRRSRVGRRSARRQVGDRRHASGRGGLARRRDGRVRWTYTEKLAIRSLALSPDGEELSIAFVAAIPAKRWNLATSPPAPIVAHNGLGGGYLLHYLPNGKTLIAGSHSGVLTILPRQPEPDRHSSAVQLLRTALYDVAVTADGRTVAASGQGGVIRTVELATGLELQTFVGHHDAVRSISWLPDGHALVSAGEDGTVKVWNPRETAQSPSTLYRFSATPVPLLAFSRDGHHVWTMSSQGLLKIDAKTGEATIHVPAELIGDFVDINLSLEPGHERASYLRGRLAQSMGPQHGPHGLPSSLRRRATS